VTSSQVSQSSIVNCWRKADILDNKNIDYSIDLNNFELDIFFKEEIQKEKLIYDLIAISYNLTHIVTLLYIYS